MDIACLPETFLDSPIPIYDYNLQIPGYSFVRADHPSKAKRGWVLEVVYVTIGNVAFCLALYLTGVSKISSVDQSELEK